jgi:hypothetical protein
VFNPGIEPGTVCVLDRRDNHYTNWTTTISWWQTLPYNELIDAIFLVGRTNRNPYPSVLLGPQELTANMQTIDCWPTLYTSSKNLFKRRTFTIYRWSSVTSVNQLNICGAFDSHNNLWSWESQQNIIIILAFMHSNSWEEHILDVSALMRQHIQNLVIQIVRTLEE